ncbi:MAG TPA: sigma-70 family RNA polymerase sigma factor [Acidimicrobiales bacterium]|nr:sigma-70 family RNA polymerase sigma factor [Acidimicrobiales bacterium]
MPTQMAASVSRSNAEVDDLVNRFRPLAEQLTSVMCARVPRSVDRSELLSAALFGLFQAARTWKDDRNVTFEAYARHRIRGALLDELRSRDWASRRVRSFARTVTAASDELTATLGRRPTDVEVAGRLGVEVTAVEANERDLHRASVRTVETTGPDGAGFDAPTETDEDPGEMLLDKEQLGYLHDAVAVLPERLRRVIVGYYVEELPMAVLADELSVTESRISQMRAEAVKLLRGALTGALDPERMEEASFGEHVGERAMGMAKETQARSTTKQRLERRGLQVVAA